MIVPVGPVGFVAWQGIRRRWPTLLLLTLVLGLTGAVVLAGVAGSRRGRATLDEFLEYHRPGVVEAFVDPSLPVARQEALLAEMVEASGSADTFVTLASVVVALPGPEGVSGPGTDITVADAYLTGVPMRDVQRALVIDGRLPLAAGEVALNERLAARRGVTVGDEVDLALFAPEDLNRVGNGETAEATEIVATTVGAIVRTPPDLARSPQAQPGTLFEADEGRVVLEPTFWEDHGRGAATYGMGTTGLLAADELAPAVAAMRAVGGDRALVTTAGSEDLAKVEPVGDAIDLESNAVLALALVVLVFGLVVLGTALARTTGDDAVDRHTFGTLGLTRRQITTSILLRGGLVTALASVLAVAVAVPTSSFFPIGLAGDAEIHPGVEVDGLVLLAGGVLFFVLVMARIVLGAWADRRPAEPPSGRALRSLPVTPVTPAALGARRVLAGLGRGSATGRLTLVTAMVGVAAVSGAATFATSLGRLVDSPERQGWTWDVVVGNYADQEAADLGAAALTANPDVAAFAPYQWTTFEVDGELVTLAEFEPDGLDGVPVVLEGRAPIGADEVALGRGTLQELGKEVGDTVEISGAAVTVTATVVGVVVAPATIAPPMDLDSGGAITFALAATAFGDARSDAPAGYLVDLQEDGRRAGMLDRLRQDFPGTVLGPMKPLDVADLERVRGVPYLLAALLGTLALVSVVVTLASAARRRRHEVAVLRSLGLARDQLRRLAAGEASTFVSLAVVVGVPVGVVAGRLLWTMAADGLGSEVGPAVPVLAIGIAVVVVLTLVNLYAQGLATVVARREPGVDLRTE